MSDFELKCIHGYVHTGTEHECDECCLSDGMAYTDLESPGGSVSYPSFEEYMEASAAEMLELMALEGEEVYWAKEHWINNPLIKPVSKVDMYDKSVARAKQEAVDAVIEMFEELNECLCASDDPSPKHYRCPSQIGLTPSEIIRKIKEMPEYGS